jgi:hypothetical protein
MTVTITFTSDPHGEPVRIEKRDGGPFAFTALAVALDTATGREYAANVYEDHSGVLECALYLNGRRVPESHKVAVRQAAIQAYREAFQAEPVAAPEPTPAESAIEPASIGSISHGACRAGDLLEAFASELEDCVTRNFGLDLAERERLTALVWDAREADPESDSATDLIDGLSTELQAFAPPYCYFGAHEGDASDYGFWPCDEAIRELPDVRTMIQTKAFQLRPVAWGRIANT